MAAALPQPSDETSSPSREEELIRKCADGCDAAWSELVDTYQNLVYAIIRRSGAGRGEEADVFQAVWVDVYRQLHRLREPRALGRWIATITRHKCYHWDRRLSRRLTDPWNERRAETLADGSETPERQLARLERQQQVRAVLRTLPSRCRQLLDLLFLEDPPRPYAEVAARLGLAVGSIGSLRGSCLRRLRDALEAEGIADDG